MAFSRLSSLFAFLRDKELVPKRQLKELREESQLADIPSALRELVRRNLLTGFQANRISQGREEELVIGPYRVLEPLGEGGMGKVYKARHVRLNRDVALKIVPPECLSNRNALSRFHREMRAVAQLSHPNIVAAFDANQDGDTHYLAMEFIEGIDLAKLVRQSGPLAIPQACDFIRQAALGLQHAHEKGLVHRDIKPGNLIVARSGSTGTPTVKILDFGLTRFEDPAVRMTRLTQLGKVLGTVDYIAPEQAGNASSVDIRADIYSLGCSLFYLFTGKPPFEGADSMERTMARLLNEAPPVRHVRADVPAELEKMLGKMLAREPANRFQKPSEVAAALEPFTLAVSSPKAGRLIPTDGARAASAQPRVGRKEDKPRRSKARVFIAASGIGVLLLGVFGVLVASGLFQTVSPRPAAKYADATKRNEPTPVPKKAQEKPAIPLSEHGKQPIPSTEKKPAPEPKKNNHPLY